MNPKGCTMRLDDVHDNGVQLTCGDTFREHVCKGKPKPIQWQEDELQYWCGNL